MAKKRIDILKSTTLDAEQQLCTTTIKKTLTTIIIVNNKINKEQERKHNL